MFLAVKIASRLSSWILLLSLLSWRQTTADRGDELCLGEAPDTLLQYPGRCDLFIECAPGGSYVRQCGPKLYFNSEKGICDYKHLANCDPNRFGHADDIQSLLEERSRGDLDFLSATAESGYDLDRSDETVRQYYVTMMPEAKAETMQRLEQESASASQEPQSYSPFHYVANYHSSRPYSKMLAKSAMTQLNALKLIKNKFRFTPEQMFTSLSNLHAPPMLKPLPGGRRRPDSPMPDSPDVDYCPYPIDYDCSDFQQFRSIEGTCNNLQRPILGRSMTPFRRLVAPRYADGIEEPRLSVTGDILPGARFVSASLFHDLNIPSRQTTMVFVFFGQFIDHDYTRTALTMVPDPARGPGRTRDLTCGKDGCDTGPGLEACMPIPVPDDDPDFPYNRCLMFVRDMEVPLLNCENGPREQLDQVTHWLDGSQIYGSTKEESDGLRDLTNPARGGLGVVSHPHGGQRFKPLLPRENDPNSMCHSINASFFCFRAGDPRVNENAGLGMIHIVWVRYHNIIEAALHTVNPHWRGERLFQEARRIVIAVFQHIVFNEWLPLLLGPDVVKKYGLELVRDGYYNGYDSKVDGRVPNGFVAAAFRIGHTLLNERLNRADEQQRVDDRLFLSETFNRPVFVYDTRAGGVDGFIRGLSREPSQTFDTFFTKQVTRSLFSERPPHGPGHDLLSLNIQRGRDHGIGTYNDYRHFCGMRRARSFNDLSKEITNSRSRQRLSNVYRNVEDVDLFAGGIYEDSVRGGIAGPTFACIIADTFRNARRGDRFWFENPQGGFTPAQLREIRKVTLARIMCLNGDQVQLIQPFVFLQPGSRPAFAPSGSGPFNQPVQCNSLPDIDYTQWRNGPYTL